MLNKISAYLSIKELELTYFVMRKVYRFASGIVHPTAAKYILFLDAVFADEQCIEASREVAKMGIIKKRLANWAYRLQGFLNPEISKYLEIFGTEEWGRFVKIVKDRVEVIGDKYFEEEYSHRNFELDKAMERLHQKAEELHRRSMERDKPVEN